jgi:hypothetical protein
MNPRGLQGCFLHHLHGMIAPPIIYYDCSAIPQEWIDTEPVLEADIPRSPTIDSIFGKRCGTHESVGVLYSITTSYGSH